MRGLKDCQSYLCMRLTCLTPRPDLDQRSQNLCSRAQAWAKATSHCSDKLSAAALLLSPGKK